MVTIATFNGIFAEVAYQWHFALQHLTGHSWPVSAWAMNALRATTRSQPALPGRPAAVSQALTITTITTTGTIRPVRPVVFA